MQTPAAALGSCRYKLGDPEENKEDFEEILQIFADMRSVILFISAEMIRWIP